MKKKFFALVIFAFSLFCYSCSFLGDCEQNSGKISFFFSGELASKMKNASSRTVSNDEVGGGGLFLDVALKGGFLAQQTAPLLDNGTSISFEEIPEGVSVFAEASAYEKVGDEKNILYTGKSESVIINEGENIISLVMLPYVAEESGSDDNSDPTSATYIGSKAPTEAKSVGSIIFSDGSFEDYSAGLTLTEMQKASAVAVIFYTGSGSLGDRVLGVGLKESYGLPWAKNGTTGYSTSYSTSSDNGSGNWAVIQTADSSGSSNAAENYPAFDYANTYLTNGFATGWYLPAINELKELSTAKETVNNAINKIGTSTDVVALKSSTTDYTYWSSSQWSSLETSAMYCIFSDNSTSSTTKSDESCYVRVIHEF